MYLHAVSSPIQCVDKRSHASMWPSWYKNLMARSPGAGAGWGRGRGRPGAGAGVEAGARRRRRRAAESLRVEEREMNLRTARVSAQILYSWEGITGPVRL